MGKRLVSSSYKNPILLATPAQSAKMRAKSSASCFLFLSSPPLPNAPFMTRVLRSCSCDGGEGGQHGSRREGGEEKSTYGDHLVVDGLVDEEAGHVYFSGLAESVNTIDGLVLHRT